jgi:hypothetical protein
MSSRSRRASAEQPLEQIGCADRLAMAERETQMRDARFEIVAGEGAW